MNRRSLLGAMLAACTAPAYVKAGILMPVREVWVPPAVDLAKLAESNLVAYMGRLFDTTFERAWSGYSANRLDRDGVEALLARDVANGCGIITIDARY